jgi:hypothetical protein
MRFSFVLFLGCCVMVLGCGGIESEPGAQNIVDAGPDGIPGAGAHAADLAGATIAPVGKNLPLGAPCNTNADCASMLCNPYPAKGGNLCTNTCDTTNVATQCPSPAVGCNRMGVCKF